MEGEGKGRLDITLCCNIWGNIATIIEVVVSSAFKGRGVATMLSTISEVINVVKSSNQRQSN
jgi:hypothetical protein